MCILAALLSGSLGYTFLIFPIRLVLKERNIAPRKPNVANNGKTFAQNLSDINYAWDKM